MSVLSSGLGILGIWKTQTGITLAILRFWSAGSEIIQQYNSGE